MWPWNRRSPIGGLGETEVSNDRTGLIVGSGGPSTKIIIEAAATTREKGPKRIGPFAVPKAMSSGPSATLATWFKIRGLNFSISSACATSTHCIGTAYEQILMGKQDVVFAGGVLGTADLLLRLKDLDRPEDRLLLVWLACGLVAAPISTGMVTKWK